jgi:hypothetical protein
VQRRMHDVLDAVSAQRCDSAQLIQRGGESPRTAMENRGESGPDQNGADLSDGSGKQAVTSDPMASPRRAERDSGSAITGACVMADGHAGIRPTRHGPTTGRVVGKCG